MTLTAIVGALVAIVARPDPWDRLEKLVARLDQLARSQAKLIDHIERLERELKAQHRRADGWREEALRKRELAQVQPQMATPQSQQNMPSSPSRPTPTAIASPRAPKSGQARTAWWRN